MGEGRRRLALMGHAKLLAAPISEDAITEGRLQIAGDFTEASAKSLAGSINDSNA